MAKKKTEFVIAFFHYEDDDNNVQYWYPTRWHQFSSQEMETVLQTGIEISKPKGPNHYDYAAKLMKNRTWSDSSGFEIVDYGVTTSTAIFTLQVEDMQLPIKIDEYFRLLKAGQIKGDRLFADLTFARFGEAKYLVEAK